MHVDVEGSTALATAAGDEIAHKVLAETKELVRQARVQTSGLCPVELALGVSLPPCRQR
jgi:hypothetical protein